jgi:Family of unknown function (DUF6011)
MPFPTDRYDDDLNDLIGGPAASTPRPTADRTPTDFDSVAKRVFEENCGKCGGSGKFRSWAGRTIGDCFACGGTGKKTFKTSPEQRAQGRVNAADRAERRADDRAQAAADWIADHKAEHEWLVATAARNATLPPEKAFTLPASFLEALDRYGSLTERQLTVIRNGIQRDAKRAEEQVQRQADAPAVDVSKIEQAFEHARRVELERKPGAIGVWNRPLKLRAEGNLDVTVEPGREGSKWQGMLFVEAFDGRKLGRIQDGKFIAKFECSQVETDAVVKACSDPHAAAKAWCQAYSECQVCGRTLTNATSIEEGIGPICREKYGW